MIVNIKNKQDTGKTATLVSLYLDLCLRWGYSPQEAIGNLKIETPGFTAVKNEELREYIKKMVQKGYRHKIILIDEADGVFPARFWHNTDQTTRLLGFWQDFKLFNWILMTSHPGKGIDLIIREAISISIIPFYNKKEDTIYCTIVNGHDLSITEDTIYPAHRIFPFYHRWQPVK